MSIDTTTPTPPVAASSIPAAVPMDHHGHSDNIAHVISRAPWLLHAGKTPR
jgi:hypothetical protein